MSSARESTVAPRIQPLSPDQLGEAEREIMQRGSEMMGFTPNDGLTMARVPGLLEAMSALVGVSYAPGQVGIELKRLVAMISSAASGCRYCQAHTRYGAGRHGVSQAKIDALWTHAESDVFSEAERAALDFAVHASMTPNQATDEDMDRLKRHFSEEEILEIVAVIALFGFLNRWNDTLKTEIETEPATTVKTT